MRWENPDGCRRGRTAAAGLLLPDESRIRARREWLRDLPDADRKVIGADLRRVQAGWPVGMPLCRSLGSGLWELRSNLPSNRIGRLLFFVEDGEIYLVHGFIKKTQKTPAEDIALARKRLKETKE